MIISNYSIATIASFLSLKDRCALSEVSKDCLVASKYSSKREEINIKEHDFVKLHGENNFGIDPTDPVGLRIHKFCCPLIRNLAKRGISTENYSFPGLYKLDHSSRKEEHKLSCEQNRFSDKNSALISAAETNYWEDIPGLIRGGADVNARRINSRTQTLEASRDMGRTLLMARRAAAGKSATPLHLAAKAGHLEAVLVLKAHGANLRAQNEFGQTALELAVAAGHPEIENALR